MNKRMKFIFIVSLFINILLLGIVIGGFYKKSSREDFRYFPVAGLSQNSVDIVESQMSILRKRNKDLRQDIRKERRYLADILSAADFDKQAYDTQSQKLQDLHLEMMRNHSQTISEIALSLDMQEREILAQNLKNKFRKIKYNKNKGD